MNDYNELGRDDLETDMYRFKKYVVLCTYRMKNTLVCVRLGVISLSV